MSIHVAQTVAQHCMEGLGEGKVCKLILSPIVGYDHLPVSSSDKCLATKRDAAGSNPSQTDTRGLKLTEEKVLPL